VATVLRRDAHFERQLYRRGACGAPGRDGGADSRSPTARRSSALSYFRKMPMLMAKYNLDGCGFWSATSWYSDPWDDLNTQVNYAKAAVCYPGSNGPINTINFAAWREGVDELLVLRALAKAGKIDGAAWAQRFLNADTVRRHDELRDELFGEADGAGAHPR